MVRSARAAARRRGGERGASAVEFALVVIPLLWLVFGIISFGMMLSFRQTLSQAATEGARAAAVEQDAGQRTTAATSAVNEAMDAVSKSCGSGGLVCDFSSVSAPFSCGTGTCVTVTLDYKYRDNPVIPSLPFVGTLMPQDLKYSATVRVS